MSEYAGGKVTGTGAAINIEIGWIPAFVIVMNETDGDRVDMWQRGMAAGTSIAITTAAATQASNGITAYSGSDTPGSEKREGFTIGSTISESAKVLRWSAWRGQAPGKNVDA